MKKSRETSDSTFAKCLKYLVIGCIAGLFLCAAARAVVAFVFVFAGENNSYTGNSGGKYWHFGIKRYVCGIFVCKAMPQQRSDYGIIQRIDFVCLRIDFRLFHGRKCIYRFHCNEVSSDDDWRRVWRCACGKQT